MNGDRHHWSGGSAQCLILANHDGRTTFNSFHIYNLGQLRLGPGKFGQPHIAALNCKVARDSKGLPTYRQGRPELITMIIGVRGNELIQRVDLLIAPASQVAAIARACQFTTEPFLGSGHLMSKQMSNESKVDGMRRKYGQGRNKRK